MVSNLLISFVAGFLASELRIYMTGRLLRQREAAKLQAHRDFFKQSRARNMALRWLETTPVCPACKTDDGRQRDNEGRVILDMDCMDLCYRYCDDPHFWHAAHCNRGTYGGITKADAINKIARRFL